MNANAPIDLPTRAAFGISAVFFFVGIVTALFCLSA